MVASGTTSKQLRRETDVRLIGYGAMLLEAMVAVVSLACVMMLAADSPLLGRGPNFLYATGLGSLLEVLGIPGTLAVSFGLMAFTTFVYDTLDVCTRLGRYVLQELTGWQGRFGRYFATAVTIAAPLAFLLSTPLDPVTGRLVPAWRIFWNLFGASNQLLAALTLIGVTVWLWRTRRAWWVWLVTGLPAAWMYVISVWELLRMVAQYAARGQYTASIPWVALLLIAMAALVLAEALRVFLRPAEPRQGLAVVPST
jgi:carbon starvation protein